MGTPKAEKFPIQLMSLKAIKVDHALQSRAKMSTEDQREFSEAMLRGDQFPPVTVFFDGKTYWLADGFHRYAATLKAQLDSIRAEIRQGTKRDAIVFSAGANQKFSIKRTNDDIKKATWMLLDDEEWRQNSPGLIAQHIGWSVNTVRTYVTAYFVSKNIEPPSLLSYTHRDGHVVTIERAKTTNASRAGVIAHLNVRARPIGLSTGSSKSGIARDPGYLVFSVSPHSELSLVDAVAEARRIGDNSKGNGWRRLLWRMADLLESSEFGPKDGTGQADPETDESQVN